MFLYDSMGLNDAYAETESLLREIRKMEIGYEKQTIHVTMTFGLAEGSRDTNIRELLQKADAKLYEGKESGRNCIVM